MATRAAPQRRADLGAASPSSDVQSFPNNVGKLALAQRQSVMMKTLFWLSAWYDPLACVNAYSSCVRFADINGNGDFNLLVGTLERKLKIFRGVQVSGGGGA